MTYQAKIDAVFEHYGDHVSGEEAEDKRYLLIERSTLEPDRVYLTSHDTLEEAAAYHDGSEYIEDWAVVKVIDLKSGLEFYATSSTAFNEAPDGKLPDDHAHV